jgi:hypothetical protein
MYRGVREVTVTVEKRYVLHILSVYVWALVIQHAMRMRRIILSSVACLSLQYFSTLSTKRHHLRGRGEVIGEFDVHVTVQRDKCLILNQLDALISQIYFGMKLFMFRTVPLSIVRSFPLYTRQWYVIQFC